MSRTLRIVLFSHHFAPSVGGIESHSRLLAEEWTLSGHHVTVVTFSAAAGPDSFPYPVVRNPGLAQWRELLRGCDLCVHNHLSLKAALPLAGLRKTWGVIIQTWLQPYGARLGLAGFAKQLGLFLADRTLAISPAVGDVLWTRSSLQGNAYDHRVFRPDVSVPKDSGLVFLGRLVSDKGADVLIEALGILATKGLRPPLTIAGSGPERENLAALAERLGVAGQVIFAGVVQGGKLADLLRRHELMVVPSRWPEPFGIVALEGLACGCVPVVSDGGGLGFAVGAAGACFERNSPASLASVLEKLLGSPALRAELRSRAAEHLSGFTGERVAAETLRQLAADSLGTGL